MVHFLTTKYITNAIERNNPDQVKEKVKNNFNLDPINYVIETLNQLTMNNELFVSSFIIISFHL